MGQFTDDVVETGDRVPHGGTQLLDLPHVLDQPRLRQEGEQLGVGRCGRRDSRVDERVLAAHHPGRDATAECPLQPLPGDRLDAEGFGGLPERPAAADPELSVLPVTVELRTGRTGIAR